jgi:hypothetical protein
MADTITLSGKLSAVDGAIGGGRAYSEAYIEGPGWSINAALELDRIDANIGDRCNVVMNAQTRVIERIERA